MKKLLTIAALTFAFAGFAEDQYFYWMVADNATLPDSQPLSPSGDYYAKISADGGTTWLNLYTDIGQGATTIGKELNFEAGDCGYVFAGLNGSGSATFLVELWQDGGSEAVGIAQFTPGAEFFTQAGMSNPASPYEVVAFTAVPEPTSGLLLLLGVAGLALRRKKMQKA